MSKKEYSKFIIAIILSRGIFKINNLKKFLNYNLLMPFFYTTEINYYLSSVGALNQQPNVLVIMQQKINYLI